MKNEFLPIENIFLLTEEYLTKRISIKLVTGEIIDGIVGWYVEDDFVEQTGIENDFGFELNDAVIDGQKLHHSICIPESRIVGYCPLEAPHTDEEIKKLFS